jgi:hypothetical protein
MLPVTSLRTRLNAARGTPFGYAQTTVRAIEGVPVDYAQDDLSAIKGCLRCRSWQA